MQLWGLRSPRVRKLETQEVQGRNGSLGSENQGSCRRQSRYEGGRRDEPSQLNGEAQKKG